MHNSTKHRLFDLWKWLLKSGACGYYTKTDDLTPAARMSPNREAKAVANAAARPSLMRVMRCKTAKYAQSHATDCEKSACTRFVDCAACKIGKQGGKAWNTERGDGACEPRRAINNPQTLTATSARSVIIQFYKDSHKANSNKHNRNKERSTMTEYKQKVLELRRMRHDHECRLARRRETFAEWFKVSVAIATIVIITAATLAILWTHNKRVERELEIEAIKQDIHVMTMKAASAVERNPNNGLARFALVLGTALYNAKVRDGEGA